MFSIQYSIFNIQCVWRDSQCALSIGHVLALNIFTVTLRPDTVVFSH